MLSWRTGFGASGSLQGLPLRAVSLAARGNVLYVVSSQGVLYRLNASTGQVESQTPLWTEGPRGSSGARMVWAGENLVIGLSELFYERPGQRSPSLCTRLVVLEARGQPRVRWALPVVHNGSLNWLVTGNRLLVNNPMNGDLVALDLHTGRAVWNLSDPDRRWLFLAADEQRFFLLNRLAGYPSAENFLRRQRFLALDAATGRIVWEWEPELSHDVQMGIVSEGRLFLIGWSPTLIALDAQTGEELWRSGAAFAAYAPMAAGDGGIVGRLQDTAQGELVMLEARDGRERWRVPLAGGFPSSLVMTRGHLFVDVYDGRQFSLRQLNAENGQVEATLLEEETTTYLGGTMAIADGRLFIGGVAVTAFAASRAAASPPPIVPPPFVTATLPTLPLYYESSVAGSGDVWRVLSDGTGAMNLTGTGGDDWDPAPSPDGRLVAFESYRTGTSELWLMRSDGGDPHPLAETRAANVYNARPHWSPDGRQIAFVSNRGGEFQIWVIRPDGSDLRPLTAEGRNTDPAWSPDGKTIAFVSTRGGYEDVWLMDADGRGARQITFTPERESSPAWSPDGQYLAFTRHAPGMDDWGQIIVKRLDGGLEVVAPYSQWSMDRNPSWSPEGTRLAWARRGDDPGKPQIVIVRWDAAEPPLILGIGKDPAWAPALPER